jgi:outer membrane protein OmpA-like peptidoglycan-associated protein
MKTKLTFVLLTAFLLSLQVQAQDYAILLASYNAKISLQDFKSLGTIEEYVEPPFHRYYLTGFKTENEAASQLASAKALGFNYARVENFSATKRMKSGCCSNILKVETTEEEEILLKNIFFDFDKSNLTSESVNTLANAVRFLKKNSDCTIELNAHTDAKGTNQYNDALSDRRKLSAKTYLISKGIKSSRISGNSMGEGTPIAKNDDDGGTDMPNGRSLNRRVELVIKRNGEVVPIVKTIDVPTELK